MPGFSAIAETDLGQLLTLARSIGWGAAEILQSYYHLDPSQKKDLDIQEHTDGPVTAADEAANQYILDRLHAALGTADFAYLTEETYKTQAPEERLGKPLVWIIDPLDGTRDFIDHTGEYAVHIALAQAGRPILSVVSVPETGKQYYATLGGGSFVETREGAVTRLQVGDRDRIEDLILLASRTHRDQRFNQFLDHFPAKRQKSIGSVGCKIAAMVEQHADLYIAISGKSALKDWDLAAPELILTEAGGQLTRFDGTFPQYNQADISQWGAFLASNGRCHAALCAESSKILNAIDNAME